MLAANPRVGDLSDDDRLVLESWVVDFDRNWDEDRLRRRVGEIPPESSLRLPALAEMVKIDLERRLRAGNVVGLESYLGQFPELGGPDDVSAELILAEYEVRRQFGMPVALEDYIRRFPHQAGELARRIAEGGSAPSRPAPPSKAPVKPSLLRTPPRPPQPPPERLGRYHILSRLGQGGMGSVYLAEDTQLGRRVALKVPEFGDDDGPEARIRFLEEARTAATLDHPALCPVYDVGEADGRLYLTMAYIEGKSLAEAIRAGGMPSRQVAALVGKLALAMQEAHDKKVIHRDLKPANVMIKSSGGRREPVIVDFGLARRDQANDVRLTRTGQVMGTLGYMAPEQIRGDLAEIGPACDIYAMGVILYELLTGRLPFAGTGLAVAGQILATNPLAPSTHRADLDPRLEAICLKAMAKKATDRHASMRELAEALTAFLRAPAARPVANSSPPSTVPRPAGQDTLVAQFFQGLSTENPPVSIRELPAPTEPEAPRSEAAGSGSGGGRRSLSTILGGAAFGLVLLGIVIVISIDRDRFRVEVSRSETAADKPDRKGLVSEKGIKKKAMTTPGGPATDAPDDAVPFRGGLYKVFNERIHWAEARKKCEEMGGTLAMIKSEDENRFVHSLVVKARLETVWLGATDEKEEGRWVWLDGSPMVYNAWDKAWQQPNNGKGVPIDEDRLAMDATKGGVWWDYSDGDFTERWPGYVCQWPRKAARDAPASGPANPAAPGDREGARLFNGARYKVFDEKISWHDARKKCEAMGGTLAIVRGAAENTFIASMVSDAGLGSAYMGATDEKVEGRWLWVDGSEMTFDAWDRAANQPNNHHPSNEPEHYLVIVMSRGGAWWDYPDFSLNQLYPGYVCQWGPAAPAR